MKGYFVIFALIVVLVASCSGEVDLRESPEDASLSLRNYKYSPRFRRETCNSVEESLRCDRWCRSIGLPGGACLRNKCDCDRF